ncbi:MAG: electron transfer flavoprotein subunit alpha/FixB family protein [Thermomicrobiales bacterium]
MSEQPRSAVYLVADVADDGALRPLSAEMVTAGRAVADATGSDLVGIVLSTDGRAAASLAALVGVDRVLAATDDAFLPWTALTWACAVGAILGDRLARAVIFPGSISGRDYAPRVAARFDAPMASDVSAIVPDGDGFAVRRPVYGGRVETTVTFAAGTTPFMTVRPGAFAKAEAVGASAPIEAVAVDAGMLDTRVRVLEVTEHKASGPSLTEAKRIVSGGRGLQGPDAFAMLHELADLIGAAVGASGAVVGQGWQSHDIQVGSTGHSVSPELYLAVGISGAPQHLVGMQGSEYVVAINRDPAAPIFDIAAFGVVGDLFEVVPALIAEFASGDDSGN